MKNCKLYHALILIALCLSILSCTKKAGPEILPPSADTFPTVPEGNRIRIHFGTWNQHGCMYSFSDCISITWGADLTNFQDRFAVRFDNGDAASQYFGNYFPLTADYAVDEVTAQSLGLHAQVIPAGLYPLQDSPTGKIIVFSPESGHPVAPLVNPNNPQDNIGQLHNLAVQVILNPENKAAIKAMQGDKVAIQQFITDKTFQFLDENGLTASAEEQKKVRALDFIRDYAKYAVRLDETRLSANDKQVLLPILDGAAELPIASPEDLSRFVKVMTNLENNLATNTQLDDPKMVLSAVSVLKYSRYFWYWKSVSGGGSGQPEPAQVPNWVWADMLGMEIGGPAGAVIASVAVYMNEH
ncbi:MAG: hypothetical protein ABIQ93_12590 [Saprospiraceae bacterium]